ncbi:MAG: DUF2282 domain-containing protein [Alphaproteobacteria bacterium]|nr:DUF2282 domain-containing protein [Alphaproteobacteria bacterium]
MKQQLMAAAVLAALVGANMAHASEHDSVKKVEREKCYGIAKAGKNDCAAKDGKNGCAGSSERNNDPSDWIYVTKGECAKLGGKTE